MLEHSRSDFQALLTFLRHTGCRPQEAVKAEIRHVDLQNRRIVFPASESKGKRMRVIYLDDIAFQLVGERADRLPHSRLFKTASGAAWDRNKIRCRFRRLKDKVGGSFCAYHLRHTFATNALQKLDVASTAALMGHSDGGTTLIKTYQHLAKLPEHMIEAARRATSI
jgi:integrase